MTKKTKGLIILGVAVLGYAFGRYVQPAQVVTKEVEVIKRDVKTVVRTVKQPDGTVIRERTTEETSETSKSNEITIKNQKSIKVNALAGWSSEERKEVYGIMVQKNMFGPISVGGFGLSDKTIGITVGIEF